MWIGFCLGTMIEESDEIETVSPDCRTSDLTEHGATWIKTPERPARQPDALQKENGDEPRLQYTRTQISVNLPPPVSIREESLPRIIDEVSATTYDYPSRRQSNP